MFGKKEDPKTEEVNQNSWNDYYFHFLDQLKGILTKALMPLKPHEAQVMTEFMDLQTVNRKEIIWPFQGSNAGSLIVENRTPVYQGGASQSSELLVFIGQASGIGVPYIKISNNSFICIPIMSDVRQITIVQVDSAGSPYIFPPYSNGTPPGVHGSFPGAYIKMVSSVLPYANGIYN